MYEALRAYFLEGRPSHEVARAFGYSPGSFRVLCHQFRRDPNPQFFVSPLSGPREQPKKSKARDLAVALRKQNHSVYEIAEALKASKMVLSPTAVREVLRAEGFAALPRRLDEERPGGPAPTAEPVADVRGFGLVADTSFATRCGGLFLFLPDLVRLQVQALAGAAKLPGSVMIPAEHALRAALALKLWSIERKSHVMALVADPGLALFCGLNATPKKSYLSEYSSRLDHAHTTRLLGAWHRAVAQDELFSTTSFNLDFHSLPYYGEDPQLERHYVSMRSRSQPSVLAFLAQDAEGRAFCYSNADLRKGEEAEEIFRFIGFWKKHHGENPRHLVFDSRLTTYPQLARLDRLGIRFITLRRRSPALLRELEQLPASAWRRVNLEVPARKYKTPRVFEQNVQLAGATLRQLFVLDLGHEEPTILLTNDLTRSAAQRITRYARRMLIENTLADSVDFFHLDALSSAIRIKVDFDVTLTEVASGLYRSLARQLPGYEAAKARQIFRHFLDTPAQIDIQQNRIEVTLPKRAHNPLLIAAGYGDKTTPVPWWDNHRLAFKFR